MLYRHTPLFQRLMQQAVVLAKQKFKLNDEQIISSARLLCSKANFQRFRAGILSEADMEDRRMWPIQNLDGRYLNYADAVILWKWLSRHKFVDTAIELNSPLSRRSFYSDQEVANALMAFYDCKEKQIIDWRKRGLEGEWVCYKQSFRRSGFVVKSQIQITVNDGEYFDIVDYQRSSGLYEVDGKPVKEISTGVGISKSYRLWFFLKETERGQPRIISLNSHHPVQSDKETEERDIFTILTGRVMEMPSKFDDVVAIGLWYFVVVLVKKETDKLIYEKHGRKYDQDEQWDLIPFGEQEREKFKERNWFIPPEIEDALRTGRAIA